MKKKTETIKEIIHHICDRDFHYSMDLDYNTEHDCANAGCDSEGICRCGKIVDIKIESTNMADIYSVFSEVTLNSDILGYCINRLLYINKLWSKENHDVWEVNVGGGYYGEEIESVKMCHDVQKALESQIIRLIDTASDTDKIKYVLKMEYGYLLDSIKDTRHAQIIDIWRSSIKVGQPDHYKKLDINVIEDYKKTVNKLKLPICVCKKESGYVRLIDGYHRFAASIKDTVDIIVLED